MSSNEFRGLTTVRYESFEKSELSRLGKTTWQPVSFVLAQFHFGTLTLCTLTSVCIFSIPCSIHFLSCSLGEFVQQSRAYLVAGHFLYSCDPRVWFRVDDVTRNWMLVTLRDWRVEKASKQTNPNGVDCRILDSERIPLFFRLYNITYT